MKILKTSEWALWRTENRIPQMPVLFGPLLLCVLLSYRNWFVIGSWRLLFFLPVPPVCALFISPMKIKFGSSCTGGIYLFLTPVKLRHFVGGKEGGGKTQNRETRSILKGRNFWEKLAHWEAILCTASAQACNTLLIIHNSAHTSISAGSSWLLYIEGHNMVTMVTCGRTDLKWKRWHCQE